MAARVLFLACFCLFSLAGQQSVQSHVHTADVSTSAPPERDIAPAGTIFGSKTPELIPDDVAIRLFLMSAAAPRNASGQQRSAQAIKLRRLELGTDDMTLLQDHLATFNDQWRIIDSQIALLKKPANSAAQGTPATKASLEGRIALDDQLTKLATATFQRLLDTLSVSGVGSVKSHVLIYMKTKITLVPPPPM